jgi:hypothetical protein
MGMGQVGRYTAATFGLLLILLDERFDPLLRERAVIAFYRYKGASDIPNIDDVISLCKQTGYNRADPGKRPAGRVVTSGRCQIDYMDLTGCHQLNRVLVVTPGGCQIGYMEHTDCHQLNVCF